jgi:hypothetical protein
MDQSSSLGNFGPGPDSGLLCPSLACPSVADNQPLAVAAVEHVKQVIHLALGHQPAEEPCRYHLIPLSFRNALLSFLGYE